MDPMQRWTLETSYRAFENGLSRSLALTVHASAYVLLQRASQQRPSRGHRLPSSALQCLTITPVWSPRTRRRLRA